MSWSTSELRVRLGRLETGLSPPVKCFYWPFQGSKYFFCWSFVLFISCVCHALASVHCWLVVTFEGKGLTSWLFIVILLLSHFCILGQVWYLIVSISDPCCLSYFYKNEPYLRLHCHAQIKSSALLSAAVFRKFTVQVIYNFIIRFPWIIFLFSSENYCQKSSFFSQQHVIYIAKPIKGLSSLPHTY